MRVQRGAVDDNVAPNLTTFVDMLFILIVFFLVCISQATETGRPQEIPKSESQKDKKLQSKNITVDIGKESVVRAIFIFSWPPWRPSRPCSVSWARCRA